METETPAVIKWLLSTGIHIGIIVLVASIALGIVRILALRSKKRIAAREKSHVERVKRSETLTKTVENVLRVAILVFAFLAILRAVGIELAPLIAGAGIAGLALSFGAQSLVKDVINGFFMLLENNLNVGDVVMVAGKEGTVERMTLRVTVLRDIEGNVHAVPNGEITTVTNQTKEWSRALVGVTVAHRENVDEAIAELRSVGKELAADPAFKPLILEPMELLGVDEFGDSGVTIKVRFKTQPVKQWQVGREFRRRVKLAFDKKGIGMNVQERLVSFTGTDRPGGVKVEIDS